MAGFDRTSTQFLQDALENATVKVMLLDSGANYTHDPAADDFLSDVPTSAEPTDASYSRQAVDDGAAVFTEDNTDNEGVYNPSDITFSSLSTTNDIEAVVFYVQDGLGSAGTDDTTAADDTLLAIYDDDSGDTGGIADLPIATNGSDLTISLNSEGLYNVSTPT